MNSKIRNTLVVSFALGLSACGPEQTLSEDAGPSTGDPTPDAGEDCGSDCPDEKSLGSFGAGDTIPSLTRPAITSDELREFYTITFTETVVLSGSLAAGGAGDYDFYLLNTERDFVQAADLGDESWSGRFIPAGDYLVEVEVFEKEESDTGFTLNLSTQAPQSIGAGAAISENGDFIEEDSSVFFTYTFSEDVLVAGTLTGTEDSDLDMYMSGIDGVATASYNIGDEAFGVALLAGTYSFRIDAFYETESYELSFRTSSLSLPALGVFTAGQAIADIDGDALSAPNFDHYLIEFSEEVLLTGSLRGNTTGEAELTLYNADGNKIFSNNFTDAPIPAGRYLVQIRTNTEAGDVDGYSVALSTSAP